MPSPPVVMIAVAVLHFFVRHDFLEHRFAVRTAAHDALQAQAFHNGAEAAGLVVNQQHLRRMREHLQDLAHNALGVDDGHVFTQAVIAALVEVERNGIAHYRSIRSPAPAGSRRMDCSLKPRRVCRRRAWLASSLSRT